MPASFTLSSLSFALPDGRVLFSDLSFSFNQERIGLLGQYGVGKSTLLHLANGHLSPSAGKISVSGKLGMLRRSFDGWGETIACLFGVRASLANQRLAEALGRAGMDTAPETLPASLSGGLRAWAALAAMIFAEPDFLLLDEPTNNLDRKGRAAAE